MREKPLDFSLRRFLLFDMFAASKRSVSAWSVAEPLKRATGHTIVM
jgi:hypothetical protein